MEAPATAPDGPNGQPAAMPPPSNITGGATQLPTRIKCAAKGPDPDPGALPPGLPKLTTSCLALSWANGEDIADSFKSKLKSNQTAPFKNEAQKRQTSTSINFKHNDDNDDAPLFFTRNTPRCFFRLPGDLGTRTTRYCPEPRVQPTGAVD